LQILSKKMQFEKTSQNIEKNRWKRVENDENLSLIWKNKANLRMGKINTKPAIAMNYDKYMRLDIWWKQSQFIRTERCVLRTAKMNLKKQSQFYRSEFSG